MTSLSPIAPRTEFKRPPFAIAQRAILVTDIREKVIATPEILLLAHLEMMMMMQ
jgi:hypothetical protein